MSNQRASVLIADDEKNICELAAKFLSSKGYLTATTFDFPSTFQELESNPGKYGLVILDYNMPGGTGDEAYHRIRGIDASIRIMLSTGENLDAKLLKDVEFNKDLVLSKPYRLATMVEKVQEALGE